MDRVTAYPKRLIEVDLPIQRISAHARREKSIRHGHISTLHIWWARRPLAACRAVLCAALWPDPADELCPAAFRQAAALAMQAFAFTAASDRQVADLCHPITWGKLSALRQPQGALDPSNPAHLNFLRFLLLDFIADFANWDASSVPAYLDTARLLTHVAHLSLSDPSFQLPATVPTESLQSQIQNLKSKIENLPRPLVVDPFAGGGAIPLEALRVGADAFASDLNPVAVLLNKVVLEYIPKYGQRLADEVRKWGQWIKEQAERELAEFYPKGPDGATPIAYLWARTIKCEGPGCGAEVPLLRSLWLAKKGDRSVALRMVPDRHAKRVDFEILQRKGGKWMSQADPNSAVPDPRFDGTVARGSATCPVCGYTTPVASVRQQLRARQGGAADARLYCVVGVWPGRQGRSYRLPTALDLHAIGKSTSELACRQLQHRGPMSFVPDEPLPIMSGVFNAPIYGHNTWGTLFTSRQALALTTLSRLVAESAELLAREPEPGLGLAVQTCLALAVDRQADSNSSVCTWRSVSEDIGHTFGRQALPMMLDFVEGNILSGSTRDWLNAVEGGLKAIGSLDRGIRAGHAECATATAHPLPDDAAAAFVTDPPYYNAVPYADLSDFFYVWLRRSLVGHYPDLLHEPLSPKQAEICEMAGWDPKRYPEKTGKWFEQQMGRAMAEGRRILAPDGIGLVVFAHKTTAGWEAMLQAITDSGWVITGSWPIDTELSNRLRALHSAALASSIHIACRPRETATGALDTAPVGEWRRVLDELPRRIHDWMPRLAQEGVVGADAIFACLGPALEIYSRYARVERANGEQVTLKEYLEQVWAAVAHEAMTMIFEGGDATGFEEDARLTAMWLWTLSTGGADNAGRAARAEEEGDEEEGATGKAPAKGGYYLEYDAARKIAQGLGAHLERLVSVVEVKGDKARLLPVAERTQSLFGKEGVSAPRGRKPAPAQMSLFEVETEEGVARIGDLGAPPHGTTVLDRVHQAMLLFAAGRSEALRRFLVEEGAGQDHRFWKLAQALSALYPAHSDEKRWVDGVLGRKKGLGF